MKHLLGFDIGGTKCAVVLLNGNSDKIISKKVFATDVSRHYTEIINELINTADYLLKENSLSFSNIAACGISCGGPLDSKNGIILSPPNLPGWDKVPIKSIIEEKTEIKTALRNDADACALAEWKFGAGKGTENMVFLTFGTGMGAGLILNGKLYTGTNGNAGEVGHIRLSQNGPVGYDKAGSFEGFCSGGGILRHAQMLYDKYHGKTFLNKSDLSAKTIAKAAFSGDEFAKRVFSETGKKLGEGISIIIDILNPELIVIGSIYQRATELLIYEMQKAINHEALGLNASVCKIVPSSLGDYIGDYASIGVAKEAIENDRF